MDISSISSRPVKQESSTLIQQENIKNISSLSTPTLVEKDAISLVHNDFRAKIRNMDLESHSLENLLTMKQLRQDGLVNIQNELLDYPEKDFNFISSRINSIVDSLEFLGEKILTDFRISENTSIYDYQAKIEVEKNAINDQIQAHAQELKARLISKQNLVAGTSSSDLDMKTVNDVKDFLGALSQNMIVDNSYIKKLLG
jgi:hypothetical protein